MWAHVIGAVPQNWLSTQTRARFIKVPTLSNQNTYENEDVRGKKRSLYHRAARDPRHLYVKWRVIVYTHARPPSFLQERFCLVSSLLQRFSLTLKLDLSLTPVSYAGKLENQIHQSAKRGLMQPAWPGQSHGVPRRPELPANRRAEPVACHTTVPFIMTRCYPQDKVTLINLYAESGTLRTTPRFLSRKTPPCEKKK